MNIVSNVNQISIYNLFFTDKKKNIIVDGSFTKLIYSNNIFSMNGIYLFLPLSNFSLNPSNNNIFVNFNPYHKSNAYLIQELTKLEYQILDYYRKNNYTNKKISNILSKQLYSGIMKLYKEVKEPIDCDSSRLKLIIKISGIWETHTEIGLAIKLLCTQ